MKICLQLLLIFFFNVTLGQHQDKVDFISADAVISIDPDKKEIKGQVRYSFEVLSEVDSVFLDAINMDFENIRLDNKKVRTGISDKRLTINKKLKQGRTYQLSLNYTAQPEQTVYFVGWEDEDLSNNQIWTQGQGKYTSHWLPSFDEMREKLVFNLEINFETAYQVIANGRLNKVVAKDTLNSWSFSMEQPMSSYLLAFGIGKYHKSTMLSDSKIPIEAYYYPQDSLRVEPTYRYTELIFNFLENEIGVPYPWQNYKQLPVRDFLYAGMENTGTTIFSDAYVVDSTAFTDKNFVNVNAHEMAHQWFGNLVTEKNGEHHWLHEGFATYYAYLAEKAIFGEEHYYWKLYESARALHNLELEERGEALTDPGASSLTFYEKGAWALEILKAEVGEEAFKIAVKAYLEKYGYGNATIANFLTEVEAASKRKLNTFRLSWLEGTDFPNEDAIAHLRKHSASLNALMELKWELTTSNLDNELIIKRYWEQSESVFLKTSIIAQYHKSLSDEFLIAAFATSELEIRQALAIAIERIPLAMMDVFDSLLEDRSYVTIENALYKLWINKPEKRAEYLERTKDVIGLPNMNVRLLWLLLASITKEYADADSRQQYLDELKRYTAPQHPFEVRQNAFALISEVFAMSDENLKDLVNASVHHAWQFRKYARTLLDKTLANEKQKQRFIQLSGQLKGEELRYIKRKLDLQ